MLTLYRTMNTAKPLSHDIILWCRQSSWQVSHLAQYARGNAGTGVANYMTSNQRPYIVFHFTPLAVLYKQSSKQGSKLHSVHAAFLL